MTVIFDQNGGGNKCIKMNSDHSFEDCSCNDYLRMVCVMDCCKYTDDFFLVSRQEFEFKLQISVK